MSVTRRLLMMASASLAVLGGTSSQAFAATAVEQVRAAADIATNGIGRGSRSSRRSNARSFVNNYLSVSALARSSLGREYNDLTAKQKSRYRSLFKDYLVEYILGFFENYSGQRIDVLPRTQQRGSLTIVASTITHKGKKYSVDWTLVGSGDYRLYDVSIEGLSLRKDTKARFTRVYSAKGYDGLITAMKNYIRRSKTSG